MSIPYIYTPSGIVHATTRKVIDEVIAVGHISDVTDAGGCLLYVEHSITRVGAVDGKHIGGALCKGNTVLQFYVAALAGIYAEHIARCSDVARRGIFQIKLVRVVVAISRLMKELKVDIRRCQLFTYG